ncbi:MAG: hypothetical protein ACP5D7_05475 [Limnospira sp.]
MAKSSELLRCMFSDYSPPNGGRSGIMPLFRLGFSMPNLEKRLAWNCLNFGAAATAPAPVCQLSPRLRRTVAVAIADRQKNTPF